MNRVYLQAPGLYAPGLVGWQDSRAVLRGDADYQAQPLPRYRPELLPKNERRRATGSVRLAFGACEDAIGGSLDEAASLASVFISSGGDYLVHDQICRGLLRDEKHISPTQFHNSVHNAPAGYWSIATRATAPSVSLAAYDYSVAAGLLEAVPLVCQENLQTLLVLFDTEVCQPLVQRREVTEPFAVALWLTPQRTERSLASLTVTLADQVPAEAAQFPPSLEGLYRANPAARILPLLCALARDEQRAFEFPLAAGGVTAQLESLSDL